jgi:hypothetical protein
MCFCSNPSLYVQKARENYFTRSKKNLKQIGAFCKNFTKVFRKEKYEKNKRARGSVLA